MNNTTTTHRNTVGDVLCDAAERRILDSISGEYRRRRLRAASRHYLATLAVAALVFAAVGLLVGAGMECGGSRPGLAAAETCNQVGQILDRL